MGYLDNIASKVNALDAKEKFNLLEVPIDKLIPSGNNFYGIREIEELAELIKQTGLLHNLVVRKLDSGMYEILSGERRFRALKLLNYSKVPCQVIGDLNDLDSELLLIIANSSARELTDSEKMKQINRLMEIYKEKKKKGEPVPKGKLRDTVGKDLGISGSQVAKYQALNNKLTKEVKDKLEDKTISMEQAKILSKLSKEEQSIKIEEIKDKGPEEVDILIKGIEQHIDPTESTEGEITDEDVQRVLMFNYGLGDMKARIKVYNHFVSNDNSCSNEFLKEVFGTSGSIRGKDSKGIGYSDNYMENGIEIEKSGMKRFMPWEYIETELSLLIRDNIYINDEEKLKYGINKENQIFEDKTSTKATEMDTEEISNDCVERLKKLLEIDSFPRLLIYNNYCQTILYTSKIEIKDNILIIKLGGFGRTNLVNVSIKEFTKVDNFPNKMKPKFGYRINSECYLWFKRKEE